MATQAEFERPAPVSSKIARIAMLLGVTESVARKFCADVQKELTGCPVSFKIIATVLQRNPSAKRPAALAKLVLLEHPEWRSRRAKPNKDKKGHHSSSKRSAPVPYGRGPGPGEYPTLSPILGHDPREFTENLPKCPHGVLLTKKCAICDPKGFRREHGMD